MAGTRYFEVMLKRSGAGRAETQRLTLAGLGLTRFGRKVFLKDTPAVRGMLYKVVHLVEVTPKTGTLPASKRSAAKENKPRRKKGAERSSDASA